jgi:Trypsin-like peptidase domain
MNHCGKLGLSALLITATALRSAGAMPLFVKDKLHMPQLFQQVYIISKTEKSINPRNVVDLRKNDGRWNLSASESKLGVKLSNDQALQLMACVGKITCPTLHGKNQGTAVSVLRPDLLVTTRHAFIRYDGKAEAMPNRCTFHNYFDQRTNIPVVVSRDDRKSGHYFNNFDYLVLRLKAPLKGCNSFAVDGSEALLKAGDRFVSVTITQTGMLNRVGGAEPVIAKGEVKQVFEGAFDGPSMYWTDVDLGAGGSGGGIFVLDQQGSLVVSEDGRLVIRAMAIATGAGGKNGEPYKGQLEKGNQSILVGVDSTFLQSILHARDELENQGRPKPDAPNSAAASKPTASKSRMRRRHHYQPERSESPVFPFMP